MLLKNRTQEEFNIEPISSEQMDAWITECVNIYQGNPCWLNEEDHIDTVNMAKTVCSEIARLAMLATSIKLDGSARAEWLQKQIDSIYDDLRHWIEYGCAYGSIILKPNGDAIDLYTFGQFEITHVSNGKIDGIVFHNQEKQGKKWFNRLEYHRFENGMYRITNKCYVGETPNDTKNPIDIQLTPWAQLAEDVGITNITEPLFGVLRMPQANNIALNSPYGLPVFSEAIQELRDLDIAYSRNAKEILDSKRTVMVDDSLVCASGYKVAQSPVAARAMADRIGLPDMTKLVRGNGQETYYQEINPTLNTDTRITGINALLGQIGFKCGFSNGHFVFNEKSGMVTATEVESNDRRTIQLIKDIRDKVEACLDGLIYSLDVFATLYGLAPVGNYEAVYDFGDITYNRDEDRARWWGYVTSDKVPAWMFFAKFEGMSEDDAKAMVAEAQTSLPTLFGGEE